MFINIYAYALLYLYFCFNNLNISIHLLGNFHFIHFFPEIKKDMTLNL